MGLAYTVKNQEGMYFITCTISQWIDVFTRDLYFSTITESLSYCRKEKGMELYGYCIMPSHVHLIFRSSFSDPSGLIRDFKGFTSRKLMKLIEDNPQESRREWLIWMFERAGKKNSNIEVRQFWQQHNNLLYRPKQSTYPHYLKHTSDYL